MSDLTVTHQTTVTEDQIDHLGHMNVRFYGVAARAATETVTTTLGGDHRDLVPTDLYTRFFREQLLGATLEVRTGVLHQGRDELRLYHELRNVETLDRAASFVHHLTAPPGHEIDLSTSPAADAFGHSITIPDGGAPRSIGLDADPLATAPDLGGARDRDLAMRRARTIDADECEADGSYSVTNAPMLVWAGEPMNGSTGPSLYDGPDGQRIGWAAMENRMVLRRLPRSGDRIQAFGAVLEIHDKATHRIMWVYDVDRADLLLAFEVVDLAFDTVQRRAVTIPDDLRSNAEELFRPEFAPRAPASKP